MLFWPPGQPIWEGTAMVRRGRERDAGKEQFWRRMLGLWRQSRCSVRDFCVEHGVSEPSFYAWRRSIAQRDRQRRDAGHAAGAGPIAPRLRAHQSSGRPRDAQPVFVPLGVVAAPTATPLEVVLGPG